MGMADWRALVAPPLDYLDFVNTLLEKVTLAEQHKTSYQGKRLKKDFA